jgi:N-acylglucosamine-6-phosphate 2-epimerase
MDLAQITELIHGGLIVSCQALAGEPLHGGQYMAAMACAAVDGGAVAIRANGPEDIKAIRASVKLPIIGLFKEDISGCEVRITPTLRHAELIATVGADVIAIDATQRSRPDNISVKKMIHQIHGAIGRPVLADVSTVEEGLIAGESGADFVATTLSGYTSYSPSQLGPDFVLLEQLVTRLKLLGIPVIAEGRISTPREAAHALSLGAHAVTVGSAITRPQWITAQFTSRLREAKAE